MERGGSLHEEVEAGVLDGVSCHALGYFPEALLFSRTLLNKYGELKLVLTWKIHPYWLAFTVLENVILKGGKGSSIFFVLFFGVLFVCLFILVCFSFTLRCFSM